MRQSEIAGKQDFLVSIDPCDKELVDLMYGEGFLDLDLTYRIKDLSNDKELYDVLQARYQNGESTSNLPILVNMLSTKGVIAESVEEDGYFICGNDFWKVIIIKSDHVFTAAELATIYQEDPHQLRGLGVTVDDVIIDDIPIGCYQKIMGINSLDDWTESLVQQLLDRYKKDLKARDQDREKANSFVQQQMAGSVLNPLFDQHLSREVLTTGQNIIFVDDPLRELALPDSFQIGPPSLTLTGDTAIYKDDYSFTDFDKIDDQSLIVTDDYIVFLGKILRSFDIDEQKISSKHLYIVKNTAAYLSRLQEGKSEKHLQMLAQVYGAQNHTVDELMCDYCTQINLVPSTDSTYFCKSCGNAN